MKIPVVYKKAFFLLRVLENVFNPDVCEIFRWTFWRTSKLLIYMQCAWTQLDISHSASKRFFFHVFLCISVNAWRIQTMCLGYKTFSLPRSADYLAFSDISTTSLHFSSVVEVSDHLLPKPAVKFVTWEIRWRSGGSPCLHTWTYCCT